MVYIPEFFFYMYLLWLISYFISLVQTMRLHGCTCNNGVVLRNEDDMWLSHLVWVVVMQRRWKVGLSIGGLGKRERMRVGMDTCNTSYAQCINSALPQ